LQFMARLTCRWGTNYDTFIDCLLFKK